jgi:hypothetical protein
VGPLGDQLQDPNVEKDSGEWRLVPRLLRPGSDLLLVRAPAAGETDPRRK